MLVFHSSAADSPRPRRRRPRCGVGPAAARLVVVALAAAALSPAVRAQPTAAAGAPELWPEGQRAFLQDGPGLLLTPEERAELVSADDGDREELVLGFMSSDPDPSTPINELAEGIERRRQLVRSEFLSPRDVRAQLLFLNGAPSERLLIDCGLTFKPLEIWRWPARPGGPGSGPGRAVVYRPNPDQPYRLWLPLDSKRVLYTSEMEYYLDQADELGARLRGPRFDVATCDETKVVDEATGVRGLRDYLEDRPAQADFARWLEPPDDLAAWSRAAAVTAVPEPPPRLAVDGVEMLFPARKNQRLVTRALIRLPAGSGVELDENAAGEPELRLAVDGVIELDGEVFEDFRVRFRQSRSEDEEEVAPIVLALERPLRPERAYVLRLRIADEVGGGETQLAAGFAAPAEPVPVDEPEIGDAVITALEADIGGAPIAGADSLVLVPPAVDVVLGLWRAEALVTGERIRKVTFLVDGRPQLTSGRRPFSVEVRLAEVPVEQVVRAEGYDAADQLVAADEVVINQTRGAFAVRITEPGRGFSGFGTVPVAAEVVVPEERRVERVEFRLNDVEVATRERPPWTAQVVIEPTGANEITYVSVVATLDDGRTAEAVRFVNAPQFLEEVEVDLVELYASVTDRTGRLVRGLGEEQFEVFEDGRRQRIAKFELVEDLPLTVGVTIDTSGSMFKALGEAQRAGKEFLARVMRPSDRCFVVGFSESPLILMPPSDDAKACSGGLDELVPYGYTSLHDAVVTSLYYFRGFRGQRALILLSDGDDTSSSISFASALEYARRSGVSIYSIGLEVGAVAVSVRSKLKQLAEDTGGRAFFIRSADELETVYGEIEEELRSRYLIAYNSDNTSGSDQFREIEVKVEGRGLEARTVRGYYP